MTDLERFEAKHSSFYWEEERDRLRAYLSQWSAGRTGERTMTALELLQRVDVLESCLRDVVESGSRLATNISLLHYPDEVGTHRYCDVCAEWLDWQHSEAKARELLGESDAG